MSERKVVLRGKLAIRDCGEDMDVLWLDGEDDDEPLSWAVADAIDGRAMVTLRWWLSPTQVTEAELTEATVRALYGDIEAEYEQRYSEITGYLWTDETLQVGGHDVLEILTAAAGSYLHMEITIHAEPSHAD